MRPICGPKSYLGTLVSCGQVDHEKINRTAYLLAQTKLCPTWGFPRVDWSQTSERWRNYHKIAFLILSILKRKIIICKIQILQEVNHQLAFGKLMCLTNTLSLKGPNKRPFPLGRLDLTVKLKIPFSYCVILMSRRNFNWSKEDVFVLQTKEYASLLPQSL